MRSCFALFKSEMHPVFVVFATHEILLFSSHSFWILAPSMLAVILPVSISSILDLWKILSSLKEFFSIKSRPKSTGF
jgi:hypothetical protein